MGKRTVSTIVLTLLIGMFASTFTVQPVRADWDWTETIYIRADGSVYPDTAPISTVDNVTYTLTDNIIVPHIQGGGGSAIVVERDSIVVDGAGYTLQGPLTLETVVGIYVSGRSNVTIRNIEIDDFDFCGIYLFESSRNNISGNNLTGSTWGIYWRESSNNNVILGNKIASYEEGIVLVGSNNTVSQNIVTIVYSMLFQYAIGLVGSNNTVSQNIVGGGQGGIGLVGSDNNISQNIVASVGGYGISVGGSNNTVSQNTVTSSGFWYCAILLDDCSNSTVSQNKLIDNYSGLRIDDSNFNTVSGNEMTDHKHGLSLGGSSHNTISGNTITNSWEYGIYLRELSNNNSISENNVIENNLGIVLEFSKYNTISGNTIANNHGGIDLCSSNNNTIYHNNFIGNIGHVRYTSMNCRWDDGYPSGGNYWSNHVTVDDYSGVYQNKHGSDGIVDEPYIIDADNRDNYPLVEPWTPKPPPPQEALEELIETIESWNLPKGTENSFTSKLEEAIQLLNMGNDNGAIHKLMDFISQVEALREEKLTNEQADYLIAEAQRIIDLI